MALRPDGRRMTPEEREEWAAGQAERVAEWRERVLRWEAEMEEKRQAHQKWLVEAKPQVAALVEYLESLDGRLLQQALEEMGYY